MIDEPAATPAVAGPPGTAVLAWTEPEPPSGTLTGFARRITDLGLGAASMLATATVDAVERFVPGEPQPPGPTPAPGMLRLVPGALLGAGLIAQRRLLDVTAAAERNAARITGVAKGAPLVGNTLRSAEGYLADWNDRGEVVQARNRALLAEFVRRLAPELATAVVTQLDMNALVAQLPIDSIISSVDMDALLERVDVQRIIDRVDVDKIVSRVDMDAIMKRVDIVPIAQEVITQVDIGSIVRASTGSIGGDARDSVRITSMRVDGFVGKVADRVLLRRKPRATVVENYDPGQFVAEPADDGNDPVEEPIEVDNPEGGDDA
jgi:hypothetical protein